MKRQIHHIIFSLALAAVCFGQVNAQDASFGEYESVESDKDRLEREKILYSPGEGEVRYIPRNHAPSSAPATTPSSTAVKETAKETEVKAVTTSNSGAKPKNDVPAKSTEKPTTTAQPKANGEGELPSFNFLYYIIQKYKLQDIVD
jgi:hypothetical protein